MPHGHASGPTTVPPESNIMQEFDDDSSDEQDRAVVQLRGLPYKATEDDVQKFLGTHCANLKDGSAIELLLGRDGRPSGFARVQFSCPTTARAACHDLHERVMNIDDASGGATASSRHRYVEVFLYCEHPGKLRFKKNSAQNGLSVDGQDVDLALEAEVAKITPDQIASEVRRYMAQEEKGELLLSMLGVALSPAARLYLRKNDRGVKRFLAQYPNEFVISGEKGRERITYMPCPSFQSINSLSSVKPSDLFAVHEMSTHHDADSFDVRPMKDRLLQSPCPFASPDPLAKLGMSPLATPSCWGTPELYQGLRPGMLGDDPPDMTVMGPLMQSVWMPWQCDDFFSSASSVNLPPPPDPRASMPRVEAPVIDPPMLRLRGLPFDATSQDILTFFSLHGVADRVSAGDAIQIMTKTNGKPSGNAIVQLRSAEDAVVVQKTLHMANFGKRYVEVLTHPPTHVGPGPPAPTSKFQQDSADRMQQTVQSAPPQAMAGSNMYSEAWMLSQLAASMAHCSTEQDFTNSFNAGFKTLPREQFGTQMLELRV